MNGRIGLILAFAFTTIGPGSPLSSLSTNLSTQATQAQNPTAIGLPFLPALQGVVMGEDARGYLVQHPQVILGEDIRSVLLSPDARFLLATREVRTATAESLLGKREDAAGEITINLWRSRTRRSSVLWRRALEPGQIALISLRGWLGTRGTALVSVLLRPPSEGDKSDGTANPYTVLHLVLDTTSGTVREVVLPPKRNGFPMVSPTQPVAALMGGEGWADTQVIFLRSDGTLSKPLVLPVKMFLQGWSADGKVLQARHHRTDSTDEEPDWYGIDPVSMTVSRIPAPRKKNGERDPRNPVQANLPLKLVMQKQQEDGQGEVWLQAGERGETGGETTGTAKNRIRLTPAGYPLGILPDLSGAIYHASGGLYFVPLLSVPADRLPPTAVVPQ